MPKHISTTKKFIRDPALRCCPTSLGGNKDDRRDYENSVVELPSIWSWKVLNGMTSSYTLRSGLSKSALVESMDSIPYFPFCEELYNFATSVSPCNWLHYIGEDSKSSTNTYIFPCGCTNPKIKFISLDTVRIKSSSALMRNPEATRVVEIPCCPVFAQGAVVRKRKRKKSKLSLTDNRSYTRKVRERSKKAAKTAKGCSKQLMDDDEPTDSD